MYHTVASFRHSAHISFLHALCRSPDSTVEVFNHLVWRLFVLNDPKCMEWAYIAAEKGSADSGLLLATVLWNGDAVLQVRKDRVEALYWLKRATVHMRDTVPWARYHYEDRDGSRVRRRLDRILFLGALKQNKSSSLSSSFFGSSIVEPHLIPLITKYLSHTKEEHNSEEDQFNILEVSDVFFEKIFSEASQCSSPRYTYYASDFGHWLYNTIFNIYPDTSTSISIYTPHRPLLLRFTTLPRLDNLSLLCSESRRPIDSEISVTAGLGLSSISSSLIELTLTKPHNVDLKHLVGINLIKLKKLTLLLTGEQTDLSPLLELNLPCIEEITLNLGRLLSFSPPQIQLIPLPKLCLVLGESFQEPFLSIQDTPTLMKLDVSSWEEPSDLSELSQLNAPNLIHLKMNIWTRRDFNVLRKANLPSLTHLYLIGRSSAVELPLWVQQTFPHVEISYTDR